MAGEFSRWLADDSLLMEHHLESESARGVTMAPEPGFVRTDKEQFAVNRSPFPVVGELGSQSAPQIILKIILLLSTSRTAKLLSAR
jgi:hypothetical protein